MMQTNLACRQAGSRQLFRIAKSTDLFFQAVRSMTVYKHCMITASGEVDNFNDPMIDNKDSNKRYRVDHLIEAKAEEMRNEGRSDEADGLLDDMDKLLAKDDFDGLRQLIINQGIKCAISKTGNWTEVRQFNLMFSTQMGSV